MAPDEIAAERERFISTRDSRRHPARGFGDPIVDPESCGWLARAAIARAEQAELRERVRELAKWKLRECVCSFDDTALAWRNAPEWILKLAEEAGVWFDDQGNEVPLDKWRARMGGVG